MIAETDLQALEERLGPARAAYQALRYEGSAPRPAAAAPHRRISRWWAALAVPAAVVVLLLVGTTEDPEVRPTQPSLNSVVEQRPLSWQSSMPEGRLAVAPGTGNLSFSVPPRPRRPDETILFEDSSAFTPYTLFVG